MKGMFYTNFYWCFETMLEDCAFSDLIQSVTQITRECYVGYVKWWMIQYDRIITVAPDKSCRCEEPANIETTSGDYCLKCRMPIRR